MGIDKVNININKIGRKMSKSKTGNNIRISQMKKAMSWKSTYNSFKKIILNLKNKKNCYTK